MNLCEAQSKLKASHYFHWKCELTEIGETKYILNVLVGCVIKKVLLFGASLGSSSLCDVMRTFCYLWVQRDDLKQLAEKK